MSMEIGLMAIRSLFGGSSKGIVTKSAKQFFSNREAALNAGFKSNLSGSLLNKVSSYSRPTSSIRSTVAVPTGELKYTPPSSPPLNTKFSRL